MNKLFEENKKKKKAKEKKREKKNRKETRKKEEKENFRNHPESLEIGLKRSRLFYENNRYTYTR